jgi:hypothetical protein
MNWLEGINWSLDIIQTPGNSPGDPNKFLPDWIKLFKILFRYTSLVFSKLADWKGLYNVLKKYDPKTRPKKCDSKNATQKMRPKKCDPKNATQKMRPKKCDPKNATQKTRPKKMRPKTLDIRNTIEFGLRTPLTESRTGPKKFPLVVQVLGS